MAKRPTFKPSPDQPQDGQVVVFSKVPPGSYCSPGVSYEVSAPRSRRDQFQFTRRNGDSRTCDPQWAVRQSVWAVAS